ncbi:hypothetical protein PG994_001877 [Apiospora phragmitis]|uniref:Trafficking protein particle complex subunit 13 n=1 Tax=Apiospora phragmitis TaxID=2905665 RepID=A0ABR1WUR9_9PEZI
MSHQRYPSMDPVKEPHSVSLKVLRYSFIESLSRQDDFPAIEAVPGAATHSSRTLGTTVNHKLCSRRPGSRVARLPVTAGTNPDPFLLTPILNLPPSFGSAYVGETFSCTLCANQDIPPEPPAPAQPPAKVQSQKKSIRDVKIEAEMKTPGSASVQKLLLGPHGEDGTPAATQETGVADAAGAGGVDLEPGQTLQKIVNFGLKEEGNHVLAVTVSYYEATETSGRTRTFRKLYQFVCKGSLIVRTKVGPPPYNTATTRKGFKQAEDENKPKKRRWIMEAQLENCSEDAMQLERVVLNLETGLRYRDANWIVSESTRPVLHPGEVEQVCFVVEEDGKGTVLEDSEGRVVFGVLGIGWRTEMGNRGFLSTGKLGARNTR